jgi:hypothetical protein
MAGIDYSKLHEIETVILVLGREVAVAELSDAFTSADFTEYDDFFTLLRTGSCPPWQTESIVTAEFFLGESQVDFEASCDRVGFDYLLASLPGEFIPMFLGAVQRFHGAFGGELWHRDERVDASRLRELFDSYVRDIDTELAEQPGNELLAILIHQSYPRRQ